MHIYYLRFFWWGQKFRNGLTERFWLGSPSWGYRQDVMQGCRYLKVVLGLQDQPPRWRTHRAGGGASAPRHTDLSSGCVSVLTAWLLASPGAGGPRESEEGSEMPLTAFSQQLHAVISTLFYSFEASH